MYTKWEDVAVHIENTLTVKKKIEVTIAASNNPQYGVKKLSTVRCEEAS